MRRWLAMQDMWTFKTADVQKQMFSCTDSGDSLLVRVRATTAGIVNGNQRLYRPDRMQDGVHSWLPKPGHFHKPVLIGHADSGETVGRVLQARYVDESYKYAQDFPIIKDSVFYRSDAKKLPLHEAVDWIVDNLLPLDDYTGLGYIELGMRLTNPDAIRKVLTDEYLTVSVGFKTDAFICSACKTDWAVDDKCDHKPGDKVGGKPTFLITGHFDYEEVSFVNFPADPFAGVVTKEKLQDSLSRLFFLGLPVKQQPSTNGIQLQDSLYTRDIQVVEDIMPTNPEKTLDLAALASELKDAKLTAERALAIKQGLSQFDPQSEEDKSTKRSLVSTVNAKIRKNGWGQSSSAVSAADKAAEDELATIVAPPPPVEDKHPVDDTVAVKLEDIEEADRPYFADEDGLYEEMSIEMDEAVKAGELKDTDIKDAKLSSEKRKGLATGTFCGPGRSFPVPDCAHVTAARRLIGRASVSAATKAKILSCVSRKAASMGCGGKDTVIAPPAVDAVASTKLTDSVVKIVGELKIDANRHGKILSHYDSLDREHDTADADTKGMMHGLHHAVGEHWSGKDMVSYYKERLSKHDMVAVSKVEMADQEEALNGAVADLEKQKDMAKLVLADSKRSLASQIVMFRVLKGADGFKELTAEQIKTKVDELAKRHITSLKDNVADILSELKWTAPAAEAPRDDKVIEPGKAVNDNVQVTEPNPAQDAQAQEAERLQRLKDEARQRKLQIMSVPERTRFLADEAYQVAAAKKK